MVGRSAPPNAQYLHQLDKARWRCTSEPIRIVLVGGVGGRGSAGPTEAQRTHHKTALDHVLSH